MSSRETNAENRGFHPEVYPSLAHGPLWWRFSKIRKAKTLTVADPITVYGYIDETGDQKADDRIFMCGYACTDDVWKTFSMDWHSEVASVGPIHATQLLSCKGLFFGWDQPRADALIGNLLKVIRTRIPIGVAVGLDIKHYHSFTDAQRRQIGDPLLACMARVIEVFTDIVDEMRKNGDDIAGIALTFDDSRRSIDMLKTWLQLKKRRSNLTDYIKAVSFADDRWFYPLQAADLLANLLNRYWQPDTVTKARTRERAEGFLRELLTPDPNFPFAYRGGFVTADEMNDANRLQKRLY